MKSEKIKSELQVHICNHKDCADRGAKEITDKLKKWAKEETDKRVKVFRSGCLGQCSDGVAIACYPAQEFLLKVKEDDVKEIKKGLLEALEKTKT